MTVLQASLHHSVTEAAQMLLFDPTKFIIPLSDHSVVPRHKSNLSTQFSALAPRVISFDPTKPIRMHRDESVQIARTSHLHVESSTSYAPRISSMSGIATKELQDVSMMSTYVLISFSHGYSATLAAKFIIKLDLT